MLKIYIAICIEIIYIAIQECLNNNKQKFLNGVFSKNMMRRDPLGDAMQYIYI